MVSWQVSRPEPTTGIVSGTVFYNDGSIPVPEGTVQIIDQNGSVVLEKNLESGNFSFEVPAGVYTINIFINGSLSGSSSITVNIGDNLTGQNVVANRKSL